MSESNKVPPTVPPVEPLEFDSPERVKARVRADLAFLPWRERVNLALEEMVVAMRILSVHHPPGENGLQANCGGNGDRIEVLYFRTGEPSK
jgi:hypothetical protein